MPRQYTPRASLICVRCGRSFTVPAYRAATARLCSAACRDAAAPNIVNSDGSISIPLHGRTGAVRGYVTVDATDFAFVSQWRWCMNTHGYAVRVERVNGRSSSSIFMHRELMGLKPGDRLEVDHVDRSRRNNRRANMRVVPQSAQSQNHSSVAGSSSSHRGVSWNAPLRKWQAGIKVRGKTISLGYFTDEAEAAEAARAGRLAHMPYAVD